MSTAYRLSLNIITYKSGRDWIAHCLQMDVVAEGESAPNAIANLLRLMAFQIEAAEEEGDFDSIFRPAPPEYWNLFARGSDVEGQVMPTIDHVSHIEAREAVLS